jgi:DNA-binding XRE family transcriptional regulator
VSERDTGAARPLRLNRRRPRSFLEWSTLRRWGKLPPWELDVPGFVLRQAREDSRLTQEMLARRLGITQQAVSRAERWTSNPTIGLMRRWLAICGQRLELLLKPE